MDDAGSLQIGMRPSVSMDGSSVFLDSPEAIRRHLGQDLTVDTDRPGACFVLCDDRNEVRAHCHVVNAPAEVPPDEYGRVVSVFVQPLARQGLSNAILLALIRSGPPTVAAGDRDWFMAMRDACAEHSVRFLGLHVVTPRGQREIVLDDVL